MLQVAPTFPMEAITEMEEKSLPRRVQGLPEVVPFLPVLVETTEMRATWIQDIHNTRTLVQATCKIQHNQVMVPAVRPRVLHLVDSDRQFQSLPMETAVLAEHQEEVKEKGAQREDIPVAELFQAPAVPGIMVLAVVAVPTMEDPTKATRQETIVATVR